MSYSFGKHCWKENSEDDYFEQKIGIKLSPQSLDLQGELIKLIFLFVGCLELRFTWNFLAEQERL